MQLLASNKRSLKKKSHPLLHTAEKCNFSHKRKYSHLFCPLKSETSPRLGQTTNCCRIGHLHISVCSLLLKAISKVLPSSIFSHNLERWAILQLSTGPSMYSKFIVSDFSIVQMSNKRASNRAAGKQEGQPRYIKIIWVMSNLKKQCYNEGP